MNKDRAHEMVEMPENENTGSSVDSTTLQNNDGKTVKHFSAKRIAYFGILTALEVVLTLWGSAIPVVSGSTAALNFSLIPIVLGAILLGEWDGALLGFISGLINFITVVLGMQPVFLFLFNLQPVMIALICIVKTTLAGFISGLAYRLIKKRNQKAAVITAALLAPIVNTLVFILGCLCISGAIEAVADNFPIPYESAFQIIILGFVSFNFFIEFAINLILAPALFLVVKGVEKQFAKKGSK